MREIFLKISESFQHLSTRERRLLIGLLAMLVGALFLFIGIQVWDDINTTSEHNQDIKKAILMINQKRTSYLSRRSQIELLEAKLGAPPLQLNGQIETLSKKYRIEPAPETNPKAPILIGKKYRIQSLDVHFPKIELESLVQLMKDLEETPLHIVKITRIAIQQRDNKHVDFGADITVSIYELVPNSQEPSNTSKTENSSKEGT